jgi:type II secretory pathway predicted ATPase ExeA
VYYEYFGLDQPPFRITPDTSLFFPGGNRGAILNAMMYAITSGEGIVKVVGEVGSGKTMLCRMLAVELPDKVEVVYLANPRLSPDNILHAIAIELKLAVNAHDDRLRVMQSLQQYLLQRHAENHQVVLFVEEAQSMPLATLEEIRLLSNLETHQHKLLQIVLFGQPELDQMLSQKDIRQLKERITYSFYLNPLNNNEILDYLNSRLRACGYRGSEVFSVSSIRVIARFSRGLLRRINILADKAMLAAYAANCHNVSAKQVRIAAKDSEFVAGWQHFRLSAVLAGVIIILLLAGWLLPFNQLLDSFNGWRTTAIPVPEEVKDIAHQEDLSDGEYTEEAIAIETDPVETIYQPQDDTVYSDWTKGDVSPVTDTTSVQTNKLVIQDEIFEDHQVQQPAGQTGDPVIPESSTAVASGDNVGTGLADFLLEKEHYTEFIDSGQPALSSEEAELLIDQLRLLPPESVVFSGADTICKLCTSIIYRPLFNLKSL